MARMPTFCNPKPTAEEVARATQDVREMQEALRQHFPWLSAPVQEDQEPDQRGFMIGSLRL